MDRLPTVVKIMRPCVLAAVACALLAGAGCKDRKTASSEAPSSRGNSAKVGAQQSASVEAFCDAHFAAGAGPAFQWPALAAGSTAPAPSTGWRWVNVWATWCKPCIEEMPRLRAWREKLAAAGKPFELAFISIDETDEEIAEFRKLHPDTPPSTRFAQMAESGAWMRSLGLTGDPPIPVHFLVDGKNRVRCARAGGVREKDYAVIEQLLSN